MYDLPNYVWAMVLTGVIGIVAATCVVLYRGAVAVGLGRAKAIALAVTAYVALGGWLVASGLLARSGAYMQDSGQVRPWFGMAVAGVLITTLLATQIPACPESSPTRPLCHFWLCRTHCGSRASCS